MGEDGWLREDLRELKSAIADVAKDFQDVLVRLVGLEHRLSTVEADITEVKQAIKEAHPRGRPTTTPGAVVPTPKEPLPSLGVNGEPRVGGSARTPPPPRVGLLEALQASQVRLLQRPLLGSLVGVFYLTVLAALIGALLGIPARQVRAWFPSTPVYEDVDESPPTDAEEPPP